MLKFFLVVILFILKNFSQMETPKKNNGDNKKYAQSEKSDFSTTHLKLHDQIYEENERLKKQIKTLEDKLNQQVNFKNKKNPNFL